MANIKSAKKRIRSSARRTEINKTRRSRIRTFIKKVVTAIDAGDGALAKQALKDAQPEIHRGVSKGLLHKNTAARTISRLSKRVKAISTQG